MPWASWAEWGEAKEALLSADIDRQRAGLDKVRREAGSCADTVC